MSTLLLPELARELAASNRRVADSFEAESRQLQELQLTAGERHALKVRAVRSARAAAAATLGRKTETLAVWRNVLDVLHDGLDDGRSNELLKHVLDTIDTWLRLAQDSRDLWGFAAALGAPQEGADELRAAEEEVRRVKGTAESMNTFLGRPWPPVDPSLLERGRNEIAQGRYRTAEQIRAGRGPAEGGAG
jgi:hypothetical protein